MRLPIVLLLLASAVVAEDPQGNNKLVVDIRARSAKEVVDVLAKMYKAKIEIDAEYEARPVTLKVNATLEDVTNKVAAQVGGTVFVEPDGLRRILPAWKAGLAKTLSGTRLMGIDWKKGDITLGSVVQYLRAVTGANFVLDGAIAAKTAIVLKADKIPAREALDAIAKQAQCTWQLRYGVVYIATAERFAELPPRVKWESAKQLQRRISVPFNETPFKSVLAYYQAATGLKFKAAKEVDAKVTLNVSDVTIAHALALTLLPLDLEAEVKEGEVHIQ